MDEYFFKCLVESHSDDLLYYARCFSLSREEAEEVVSDVFFEVWRNKNKIEKVHLKAWLVRVTHNKAISYLRKKRRSSCTISFEEAGDFTMPGDLQTPDEQIISCEEMEKINRIIKSLPPRCRQVFVLAKIEKLPYKEISRILDISVKTINTHIAKALELISEALKK
jgi:RNA polymerase sigma-70 factor (ECF subfamily)